MKAGEKNARAKGFTLLEVIAALVILSVLSAMMLNATGSGLWKSAQGVSDCRSLFELQDRMEQIVQTYKRQLAAGGGSINLATFRTAVLAMPFVDASQTGYLTEVGGVFSLTPAATQLFLVTLTQGDQSIGTIFSN